MRLLLPIFCLFALVLLAPDAAAGTINGYSHVVHVRDEAKHATGQDNDVTYADYTFDFSENAPDPNARAGSGWTRVVLAQRGAQVPHWILAAL